MILEEFFTCDRVNSRGTAVNSSKLDEHLYRPPFFSQKGGTALAVPAASLPPALHWKEDVHQVWPSLTVGTHERHVSDTWNNWNDRRQVLTGGRSCLHAFPTGQEVIVIGTLWWTSMGSKGSVGALWMDPSLTPFNQTRVQCGDTILTSWEVSPCHQHIYSGHKKALKNSLFQQMP